MANDTLTPKRAQPCEPMPLDRIDGMLKKIYDGSNSDSKEFRRAVLEIDSRKIRWEKLHHLRIIGDADTEHPEHFERAGLSGGYYLNADKSWLLVILPEKPHLEDLFRRCGKYLESLYIWNSKMYARDWNELTNLSVLHLQDNPMMDSTEGLGKLTRLSKLFIYNCDRLTQIQELEKLTTLTELLVDSCRQLTALPGLENLKQLTHLNLRECSSLTALPGLENLKLLTSLVLSGCSSLTSLPGLENLKLLTGLYLSACSSITSLPGLKNLIQLTKLNLWGCHSITALPGLENLKQLTNLKLSGCRGLTALPEGLRHCSNLRYLDLSRLQLEDLPDWLPEIAERFTDRWESTPGQARAVVYLYGTTVATIPDMSIFDQPYEMVVEWFENRRLNTVHLLNEIKVVFLGDGEAGKSHTIARLMNDGGEPDHVIYDGQSTPGIVIRNKEYDLGNRKITVHYWDFGGQEIMHSMHRIFLTGRTMYVILLNARDDTQGDRAKYWLHNVRSFAPDAPVLLVLNKIDQNPNASVDEKDLRGRYDKLTQVVRLSARDFSQEKFNSDFTDVLLAEIQKTGFLDAQWPTAWTRVKEKLENMETHYIMGGDYQALCRECQVDDNQKNLLHWFNDLGVSFCCDGEDDYTLEDYVILRPDWITNALYIILFNQLEGARNGLIPHKSIYNLLKNAQNNPDIRCTLPQAKYTSGDIDYVLRIMRKFNLSFAHGTDHEFIPMLCQQDSMADIQYYHRDAEILEFNMEFDYLPNNLLHRLMVERHQELDMTTVWRTGARFQLTELGYSAVVVIDSNILRFFIRHSDPMHRPNTYLTMLKAHVDRIVRHMGLKAPACQLIYKLDGRRDEFDFEELKMLQEVGQNQALSKAWRRMIPIVDILNQSAPDSLDDERKLLDRITQACGNIQDEPLYRLIPNPDGHGYENGQGMEDLRNRRIRDNLLNIGYRMSDQTQRGVSSTGKSTGELDMLIYSDSNSPWTIIEALRVSDRDKSKWNEHLERLSNNYNTRGLSALYLLTYVDADTAAFAEIWKSYQSHIQAHDPGQLKYAEGSFAELEVQDHQHIKVAKCSYCGGVSPINVYHIFALIPIRKR